MVLGSSGRSATREAEGELMTPPELFVVLYDPLLQNVNRKERPRVPYLFDRNCESCRSYFAFAAISSHNSVGVDLFTTAFCFSSLVCNSSRSYQI